MDDTEALEKSLQYSIWKICSFIAVSYGVNFSKEFVHILQLLTSEQIKLFAEDLEMFARHAKRTVINGDDVKLLVRRIPNLSDHINQFYLKNSKSKAKCDKRKNIVLEDEDSNDMNGASTSKSKKAVKKKIVSLGESSNL